ncbi:unnamed protein product [Chondrus crispus]|uniref:Uncharacterized protein n=1 Tax=Chondrus crispus TaxID=2769 RepID=R7QJG5_CHOCR|nr:unnamed protein product [Chondrus crispus]CDF37893.1 unnamed protein product [Chondrus crispus]|eukprot:XP_005717764.1 unnamed protein product [Chondrus crispus]
MEKGAMAAGNLWKVGREAGVKALHDKVDVPRGARGATAGMKAGSILDEWVENTNARMAQGYGGVVRVGLSLRSGTGVVVSRGEFEEYKYVT